MRLVPAPLRLVLDIVTVKFLVWAFGCNGELLDSHLFFFDRYSDLADWCAAWGFTTRAERWRALAEAHYQLAPDDDDPPEAAGMALPLPESYESMEAIGQRAPRRREGSVSSLSVSGA